MGPLQWVILIRPCIQHPRCLLRVIEGATAVVEIQISSKMFKGRLLMSRNLKVIASWLQVYQQLKRYIKRDPEQTKIIQLSIRPTFHKASRKLLRLSGLLADQELVVGTWMGLPDLRVKLGMIWFQLKCLLGECRLRHYQSKILDLALGLIRGLNVVWEVKTQPVKKNLLRSLSIRRINLYIKRQVPFTKQ